MPEPLDMILDTLACIVCRTGHLIRIDKDTLRCGDCGKSYRIINNVPCFVAEGETDFSEVMEADRQKFLEAKRLAYFKDSFVSRLYNHYHKYAASRRELLSADAITVDIGFGMGEHYPFITESEKTAARFIGVDTDRFKLEHFNAAHPEMPVIQASALRLPFRAATVDVVQLLATLEHFEVADATAVLHEALRVLKPGGYLIACYPAEGSLLLRGGQIAIHRLIRFESGFDFEQAEVHHHYATAKEIGAMLTAMPGLSRLETIHYPLNLNNIHLSLFLNELYRKDEA